MSARFATAILICSFAHAQQASLPEPQYAHQFNAVVNGQPVVLERQTAVTDTKSHRFFVITPSTTVFESINNPASPVRVGPGTHFIVRLPTGDRDPQTLIHLQKLTLSKKDRQVPIVTYKVSLIPGGGLNHKRAPDEPIPVTIQQYGAGSLEITPLQPLDPGEYAFMSGHEAQCFGVDAGLSSGNTPTPAPVQAAAPAPPPPPRHPAPTVVDLPPAAPGYPPMHASNPAQDGCWWTPFVSQNLGLEMAVSHCETNLWAVIAAETPTGITLASPGSSSPPEQVLTLETKPAGQTMEAAIKQQFILKLKVPAARLSCRAQCDTAADGATTCKVIATGSYAKLKKFNREDDSSEDPCPGLITTDAVTIYFLARPSESKAKFLYVTVDDLASAMNDATIHFLSQP